LVTRTTFRTASYNLGSVFNEIIGGVRPEAMLLYVRSAPGSSQLDVGSIELVEWRRFTPPLDGQWVPVDQLRGPPNATATLTLSGCSSTADD
jgi:hypothetical protein